MKFRFLYVGDKILSHREEGLFRVLNCEEYSLNKKVLDYKEICNRKKYKNGFSEEKFNRIYLSKRGSVINFYSLGSKEFNETYLSDINRFKDLLYLNKNGEDEEIKIIFFDLFNKDANKDELFITSFMNKLGEISKDINWDKILIIFNEEIIFNKVTNIDSRFRECSLVLNNYDVNLNEFIHILIDFLLLNDDLVDKWSEYRKKIANSKLTLGKVRGEDFSGEVIMRILGEFSKIQRDNLFKLILMSKEGVNLNEIALIEDALKEYISLDSKLIIKQLTKDFFNDEVRYILISK
ncbi:hypothetical protein KLF26_03105 [Clostridium perfringens]|uniref:hypothetical protein n=1 Tax=Clostridium perfringens TaxID=1502 RepID=UPI001CCB9E48|nr:hypothetical protein [Clostridium perfringens]EJT6340937.1 hypothetical protein [Clostridium perfringens]ELQ0172455.1 hypothetical protein [Clostridium perfringens]UBK98222.1 hypothetical protein KLF26_03105 [Clostridium perfringens]CAJ1609354.1 hypothetical protein CLO5623_00774 [Clostridium perfringens]BDC00862.1 hypothetical protein CP118TE_05710 [Clostridium perfringens E]